MSGRGDPEGKPALHVLFGFRAADVLAELEKTENARTVELAVVWDFGRPALAERGIEARKLESDETGATHELLLYGVAGLERLRVICYQRGLLPCGESDNRPQAHADRPIAT